MRGVFLHPLTSRAGPHPLRFPRYRGTEIPINRGRAPSGLFYTPQGLLLTTYYLLPTTYYLNTYFLSFFSPFPEKTLTNFNIHLTRFVNYKGHPSAENTHNFSYNTNNFSFSPNIFSDSPRNFTDFPAIFGIKKWRYPELPRYLHFRTTKIINFKAKCKSVNFR